MNSQYTPGRLKHNVACNRWLKLHKAFLGVSILWVNPSLFLELPFLPTHGAWLVDLLRIEPLDDTMDVETVGALSPNQRAVISRQLTIRATAIKRHTTDATVVVIRHPPPRCNCCPTLDFDFHPVAIPTSFRVTRYLFRTGDLVTILTVCAHTHTHNIDYQWFYLQVH